MRHYSRRTPENGWKENEKSFFWFKKVEKEKTFQLASFTQV